MGAGEKVYPLGLSRLSGQVPGEMEKYGLDMNVHMDPWLALKEALSGIGPDIVALSFRNLDPLAGHQASYLSSLKTAALMVETLAPRARLLAGGPAFSMYGLRLMEEIGRIDIGLTGEGELVFPELLREKITPGGIPGIIWRDRGRLTVNPAGRKISMDALPGMDTKTFPPVNYTKENAYVAAMGIEGKRGCDLRCGYCLYPFLGGTCMRLRPPAQIVDEMEMLQREHGIELFHFTDPVVNRPADHFEALCRELLDRDLDLSWTGFFREDTLTDNSLALAVKSGLCAIYFSGDALTTQGLKLLNKQMTLEDIFRASRLTVKHNVLTMCHFLINLPGDDLKTVEEAGKTLAGLLDIHSGAGNLGAVIFNHVRLYPAAPLTRKLIKTGDLHPETDLLYPVYHNPEPLNHVLHEFEAVCHSAGVFSRLGLTSQGVKK